MARTLTSEDKALVRGMAMALAEVARSPPGNGVIEGVLRDAGLDAASLRAAGVDPHDMRSLYRALQNNRLRARRERRASRPRREGGET